MSSAMDTDATQVVDNATDNTEDNTTDNTADNGVVNNADIKEESPEDDNIIGDDEVVDEVNDGNNGTDGAADVNDNPDGADGDAVDEEVLLMETDCKDITAQSNDATNGDTIDDTGDGNVDESGGDGDGDGISVQLDDNELRTAGLKTSLMLSEEKIDGLNAKVSELESELKKVYQHLITSMDDKKKLEAKCATLQEQLDRVMSKKAGAAISQLQSPQQQRQHQQQSPPKRPAQLVAQKRAAAAIKQSTRVFNNNNAKTRATDRFAGNARPYEVPAMRYTTFGDPYRTPVAVPVPSISNASRQPYGYGMSGPMMANPKSGPLVSSGHEEIEELSARLQVPPHVADKAHQLYEDFYDSVQAMAVCAETGVRPSVAALYLSARMADYQPLTYKKIHDTLGVSRKDMQSCCQEVSDILCLGVQVSYNAMELVQQFGHQLGVPMAILKAAAHVAKTAMNEKIVSAFNPPVLASAALLLTTQASSVKRSQTQLAIVSRVPEDAIVSSYRVLRAKARQLFPHDFVFSTPIQHLPQ